jgi:pimeloyl-ACP methyl ester carboxylesterase
MDIMKNCSFVIKFEKISNRVLMIIRLSVLLFFVFFQTDFLIAQNLEGHWRGKIESDGISLRLAVHAEKTEKGWKGTMDSPDQQAFGIPLSFITQDNTEVVWRVGSLSIQYRGGMVSDSLINGKFTQGGFSVSLNLSRFSGEWEQMLRPQEPVKPYAYIEEELRIQNPLTGLSIGATLVYPDSLSGPVPAVLLVSGSGPQDRNEEIMGHKPFWVIADFLVRNGIAVLRYDDPGVGSSEGDFNKMTTHDLADYASFALEYLRNRKETIDTLTGLIGHSEGALIGFILASKEFGPSFVISLAGPGVPLKELLLTQIETISALSTGMPKEDLIQVSLMNRAIYEIAADSVSEAFARKMIVEVLMSMGLDSGTVEGKFSEPTMTRERARMLADEALSPWFRHFLRLKPSDFVERISCPTLLIQGEKDVQVDAESNLNALRMALRRSGAKTVNSYLLPDLNHLLQPCITGLPSEYGNISITIDEQVLAIMARWINARISQ